MDMTDWASEVGRSLPPPGDRDDDGAAASAIPVDIRNRLTGEQQRRLEHLLPDSGPSRHGFAYRVSSSVFGKPFYVALFAGIEKRCPDRVADAGQRRGLWRVAVDAILFGWWILLPALLLMVGAIAGAYFVKSWLGIDLFDQHFVMHGLFFE